MSLRDVTLGFSAHCSNVADLGYSCMVCSEPGTGHLTARGGLHHGRCLLVLCPRHASQEGYDEVKAVLVQQMMDELLSAELGPGPLGPPQVWHRDHWDALPEHRHEGA